MENFARVSRAVSLVLFGMLSQFSFAAITIDICGDSTYTCKPPADARPSDQTRYAKLCYATGKCVYIQNDASSNPVTPPGWTSPTSPPATASQTVTYAAGGFPSASSKAAACVNIGGSGSACGGNGTAAMLYQAPGDANPGTIGGTNTSGGDRCLLWCDQSAPFSDGALNTYTLTTTTTCPTGYTVAGATCNLTSPTTVQKPADDQLLLKRSGNSFAVDPQDTADATALPSALIITNQTISMRDGNQSVAASLDATTGRGTVSTTLDNGDGTYTTSTVFIGPPSSTTPPYNPVTSNSTGTYRGTGDLAGPAQTGTSTCGGASQPPCATAINETGTPTAASAFDPNKTALDALLPGYFGKGSWSGTPHAVPSDIPTVGGSSSCTNPASIHIFNTDVTMDICALWGPLKSWFAWGLYAFTALYMWRRMMKVVGA